MEMSWDGIQTCDRAVLAPLISDSGYALTNKPWLISHFENFSLKIHMSLFSRPSIVDFGRHNTIFVKEIPNTSSITTNIAEPNIYIL